MNIEPLSVTFLVGLLATVIGAVIFARTARSDAETAVRYWVPSLGYFFVWAAALNILG